jgi:alpha-mannosidase
MAKKTETTTAKPETKKAASKKAAHVPKAKVERVKAKTASPFRTVKDKHDGKEKLAKALSTVVGAADDDTDVIAARLKKASNKQLLRLHAVHETVKRKFGSRAKLIAKLTEGKTKDKDFVEKLATYSLPHLLDLASHG